MNAKFKPGTVVATPGAVEALAESGQDASFFLDKHVSGDWGEVDADDQKANDQALIDGSRLLSSYRTLKGVVIWVLTEAEGDDGQRASSCLTLPEEY
jgi:hypothetical protein